MTDFPTPEDPLEPTDELTQAATEATDNLTDAATEATDLPTDDLTDTVTEATDDLTDTGTEATDDLAQAVTGTEAVGNYSDSELLDAADALAEPVDTEDLSPAAASDEPSESFTFGESNEAMAEPAAGSAGPAGPAVDAPLPPPASPPNYPPPGYGAPPPVRRLYRSRHDRKLGGVSAGIAEHFHLDPTIVRLATLASAISGVGLLVYLVAWVVVPLRPEGWVEPNPPTPVGNERTMTVAFGVAALALAFGIVTGSWAVLAIALIGGGIWLLSEQTRLAPAGVAPGVTPAAAGGGYEPMAYAAAPTAAPPQQPHAWASQPAAPTPGYPPPQPQAGAYVPPPVKERKPQRITWTVLSLLALLAAVGIAAASGDWFDVSAVRFIGIGIVIIGVGVVIGQLRGGGARGLIPLGILAALALFPISAVDGLLDEGIGDTAYRPQTIAELESSYKFGIGEMVVDLSQIDFEGRSDTIDIDLGIGELIVIVSEDTGGHAILEAKAGELSYRLPGARGFAFEEGVNVDSGTIRLGGDDGNVELTINVGFGTAELRSAAN